MSDLLKRIQDDFKEQLQKKVEHEAEKKAIGEAVTIGVSSIVGIPILGGIIGGIASQAAQDIFEGEDDGASS